MDGLPKELADDDVISWDDGSVPLSCHVRVECYWCFNEHQ